MLLKICGLRYRDNINAIRQLNPDFMGFIFYPKSPRYVGDDFDLPPLPKQIKKVGVFVNEDKPFILNIVKKYQLDYLQLHGSETPDFCKDIKRESVSVIKAFSVQNPKDLQKIHAYENSCDLALLDTKTKSFGGSGKRFNWNILNDYTSSLNFMLSGGLGLHNIHEALKLKHDKLIGFDVNSQLELEPALKSVEQTQEIIQNIRDYERY